MPTDVVQKPKISRASILMKKQLKILVPSSLMVTGVVFAAVTVFDRTERFDFDPTPLAIATRDGRVSLPTSSSTDIDLDAQDRSNSSSTLPDAVTEERPATWDRR
jgi:hypothetical protein